MSDLLDRLKSALADRYAIERGILPLGSWASRPVLTLAVGLITAGCSPEPSIEQTSAWLIERIPQFTEVSTPGLMPDSPSEQHEVYEVAIADCMLSFTSASYAPTTIFNGASVHTYERYRISLTALDLTELVVVRPSEDWMIHMRLVPGSSSDEMSVSRRADWLGTSIPPSTPRHSDWSEYESSINNIMGFYVDSEENAERIRKALHHLARKCGAKASPF